METNTTKILEKILLPISESWEISNISVDEANEEIYVDLKYLGKTVNVDSAEYPIYDFRSSRTWRHLDLWQYKTYLRARMPRYKDGTGVKTINVPWAEAVERITNLLEKKNN